MTNRIEGKCHCGNLSFELLTETPLDSIRARACDCRFCRIHAAMNWSDPKGSATIRIADESELRKYRFAFGTADFYLCRVCGSYLGALLADDEGAWSTLNLRLTELDLEELPVSYGSEDRDTRVARRKLVWTPTVVRLPDPA